jgi:hypothetical protein
MHRRLVALLVLALSPVALASQSAVFAGFGIENGEPEYAPGLQLGGRFSPYVGAHFGVRVDLAFQTFVRVGTYATSCPFGGCVQRTGDAVKIFSANSHLAIFRRSGFAWTAGVGLYGIIESPHDGAYTRPGWNVGFSAPLGRAMFFEARYHGLVGRQTTRGFTSASLGVGF